MISNMAQRARMRLRRTRVPAANMAVVTGSATSDVASGFIAASGRNTSDVNGGEREPDAGSLRGSVWQNKKAGGRGAAGAETETRGTRTEGGPRRAKPRRPPAEPR